MRGAFVDPGGDLPRLKAAAQQAGVTIEKILLTHGHIDHCGSAGMLAEELGVQIEGPHEADRFWIDRLRRGRARNTASPAARSSRRAGSVDGDQVTVGELTFDVRHCPGHTPGHVVFHHPESKLALVGDVLFQRLGRPLGLPARRPAAADPRRSPSGCGRWATRPRSCRATARCPPSATSGNQSLRRRCGRWRRLNGVAHARPRRWRSGPRRGRGRHHRRLAAHHADHPQQPLGGIGRSMPKAWRMRASNEDSGDRCRARRVAAGSSIRPIRIRTNGTFSMKLACARIRRSSASLPPSPTIDLESASEPGACEPARRSGLRGGGDCKRDGKGDHRALPLGRSASAAGLATSARSL